MSLNIYMLYENLSNTLGSLMSKSHDVGFFISGGLDSSVLLYACCNIKQYTTGNARLQAFTIPTGQDVVAAQRVICWMEQRFNIEIDQTVVEFDSNLHHSLRVRSALSVGSQMCDYILLGDTTNPSHLPNGPERVRSTHRKFIQPFFEWTKQDVVALIKEINIPNELIALTNSCSIDCACGQCWECYERAWGFAVNGIADPKL